MAPNGFPGGQAVLILIPFVIVGIAVYVLTIAVRDPAGRPKHSLPRLPDPSTHPLHHVRVSMAATKRKARIAARRAQEAAEGRPRAPGDGSDEVVHRLPKRV